MGRFDGIHLKHSEIGPSQVMCVLAGPDQTGFILFVGHPWPKELCALYLGLLCEYTETGKWPCKLWHGQV